MAEILVVEDEATVAEAAERHGHTVQAFQSNHEGALVDAALAAVDAKPALRVALRRLRGLQRAVVLKVRRGLLRAVSG